MKIKYHPSVRNYSNICVRILQLNYWLYISYDNTYSEPEFQFYLEKNAPFTGSKPI